MDKKNSTSFDEAIIKIPQPGNEDQSTILAHLPIYQTKVGPDGKITIVNQFKTENVEKHLSPPGKIVKISLSDGSTKAASISLAPGIIPDNHDREKLLITSVIQSSSSSSSSEDLNRSLKKSGKPNIIIQHMNNKLVSLQIKPSTPQQFPSVMQSHNISILQKKIPAVIKPIMSTNATTSAMSPDTPTTSGNISQLLTDHHQEQKKILKLIKNKLPIETNKIKSSSFNSDSSKPNEIPKIIISNGKTTKILPTRPIVLNEEKSTQQTSVKIHKNNSTPDQSQFSQQLGSNVTISKISTMVQKKEELQQQVIRRILEPSPLVTIQKKNQQLGSSTSPISETSPEDKIENIYLEDSKSGNQIRQNFGSKEKQNKNGKGCFINIYQQHLDKEKKRYRRNSFDGISPLRKKFNIMLNNFPKISLKNSSESNIDSLEKALLNIKPKNPNNSTNSKQIKLPLISDEILKKFHVAAAKTATDIVKKRYKAPINTVIKKINHSNTEKLNSEEKNSTASELCCEDAIESSDADNSNSSTTKLTSGSVVNTNISNDIDISDNSIITSQQDNVLEQNNFENLERSPRGRSKSLNLIGPNSEMLKRSSSAETDNGCIDEEISKLSPDNETDEMKLLCAEKIQVSPDSSKSTAQLIQTIHPNLINNKNIVIMTQEQFAAATAQHTQAMMDYEPIKQEILELNKSDFPSPTPAEAVFFFDSKSLNTNNSFADTDTINKPIVPNLNLLSPSILNLTNTIYDPLKAINPATANTNGNNTIFVDEKKLKELHHLKKLQRFQQIKMQQVSSAAQIQQEQFNQLQMQSYEINKKSQQLEEKLKKLQVSQKHEKSSSIILTQNLQFHQEYLTSTPKPKDLNDLHSVLSWQNDIGITKDSRLPFQLNEFGLIEFHEKIVLDRNQIGPENYSLPIFARENKSQNTSDYGENLYFCEGCKCHGAAVDFLAPNFCSKACILRIEKKKHSELKDGSIRRDGFKREKKSRRLNNWLAPKLNTSDSHRSVISQSSPPKRIFTWATYLESSKAEPAGIDLFLNPFPCGPNQFQIGMKLEAVDPEHMSLFCVSTIVEKKGFRLKLHFDNYPSIYDFWVNADSMDIFPPGWCNKTNRTLMPPKNTTRLEFNWSSYLIKTKSQAAPRHLFTHLNTSSLTNPFKAGMKFEADDLRNSRMVCVASVADVLDNRILVHFDGWDNSYDYWVDCTSPYIHPVNWHLVNNFDIVSPPNWQKSFVWKEYLQETNGIPATEELFHTRLPIGFKPGMKLELVDKKNPSLIRPGTVIMAEDYELTVIYDGWPSEYAFSVIDDNLDIHPIGWCEATGHELESPPGFESLPSIMPCPMPGCRGIGNTSYDVEFHATLQECPYNLSNWSKEIEKPTRVEVSDFEMLESRINKRKIHDSNLDCDIKPKILKSDFLNNLTINYNKSTLSAETLKSKKFSNTSVDSTFSIAPVVEEQDEMDQKLFLDPRIKISKKLLLDYGPRLEQNHIFWLRNYTNIFCNAPFDNHNIFEKNLNPLQWSTIDVYEFIKEIPECGKVAEMFRSEDIDGEALLALRQTDLTEIMQLKLGPAVKIYNRIIYLRGEVVSKTNDEKVDNFHIFGNLMNGET